MEEVYEEIYIKLNKEESAMIEAYADEHRTTPEAAIKQAMNDMIKDWVEFYSMDWHRISQ